MTDRPAAVISNANVLIDGWGLMRDLCKVGKRVTDYE